jgi:hypothetical protein
MVARRPFEGGDATCAPSIETARRRFRLSD